MFCRYCGATQQPPPITGKRLVRLPAEARIAGVCAGLADYFEVDVTLVRLAWVILSIVPGGIIGGVIVYVVAWAVVPPQAGSLPSVAGRRLHRSATDIRIAGVCAGIAEYFEVDPTVVRVLWAVLTIVPGAIVLGVFAYLLAWLVMPPGVTPPMHVQTAA
jgi:phage shock protein PspC (stress-responsive transcriptional regulator)